MTDSSSWADRSSVVEVDGGPEDGKRDVGKISDFHIQSRSSSSSR